MGMPRRYFTYPDGERIVFGMNSARTVLVFGLYLVLVSLAAAPVDESSRWLSYVLGGTVSALCAFYLAGCVLALDVDVPGLPANLFH